MNRITRKGLVDVGGSDDLDGGRRVVVVCSTGSVDRTGDLVEQSGLDLENFRRSPTVLWNHDHDHPVARAVSVDLVDGAVKAVVQFPPEGDDPEADLLYRRIRNGVVNSVSIGFGVLEAAPADGKNPKKGLRITRSELYEFSFVSVAANPDALIEERALLLKALTMTATRAGNATIKGLWEVSALARQLSDLSWLEECVEWEAEIEADGSDIPARLAEVIAALGGVLVDMTIEEVSELIGAEASEETVKAFLVGKVKAVVAARKSGAAISKANRTAISDDCRAIQSAHDTLVALVGDEGGADEDETVAVDEKSLDDVARRRRIADALALAAP